MFLAYHKILFVPSLLQWVILSPPKDHSTSSLVHQQWSFTISILQNGWPIWTRVVATFSWFLELVWISYSISKWRFSCSLNNHICPRIYVDVELKMVIIFEACSSISFKHMNFWYMFLESHQSTYHSHMVVLIRKVFEGCLPYRCSCMRDR